MTSAAAKRSVSEVKEQASLAASDSINACESIQREILFQQQKQFKNRIQGFLDGVLLQSEIPEDMQETAQAFLERQDASDKKRIRTKQLQHDKLSRSTPRIQGVHKMWLQEESWADEFRMFTYTADLEEAIFFAVKDAANPPPLVLWTVVLQGGFLIDLSHLRYQANGMPNDAKDRGATFAYEPAVRTQRRVLISPKMRQNCPRLCRLIDAASRSRLSKWQQMSSWEEFAERCSKDGKNTFNTISLCTSAEANALEGRKNVFNQDGFLKFLRRVACVYNLK